MASKEAGKEEDGKYKLEDMVDIAKMSTLELGKDYIK